MNYFITGASGFLGKYLIKELSKLSHKLYLLSRNPPANDLEGDVQWVKGDITSPDIIEDPHIREDLLSKIDIVIHAAALYDLKGSYSDCFLHNVVGTQNMIRLLYKMKCLKSFFYISTIAVADESQFYLYEDALPDRNQFNDYYSQTKYISEEIVRKHSNNFPIRIIRPGVIVGDSVSGQIDKFDGPYYFINAIKKNISIIRKLPFMPLSYNPRTLMPIIPVDHCASMVSLLCTRDNFLPELKTYHLISEEIPSIRQFLEDLRSTHCYQCTFLPVDRNFILDKVLSAFSIPEQIIPFMFSKLTYDKTRTNQDLPELKLSRYSDYKMILLK